MRQMQKEKADTSQWDRRNKYRTEDILILRNRISFSLKKWWPKIMENVYMYHSFLIHSFKLHISTLWWLNSKESTCQWKRYVWSLGQEDALKKEMATHSSILAWRIPWTEEPGGLQFMGLQRVGYDLVTKWQELHSF